MLTTVGWLFVDHHARTGTLAQLHTNHTGRQRPSWVTKRQLSWGAVLSLRIIITSLFYIQEISISICFVPQGAGRVGVGQIGPRFAARVKNSPENSRLLGLLALTIDRFLTSVGFYTLCRVNMEFHQVHRPITNIFTDFLYKIIILLNSLPFLLKTTKLITRRKHSIAKKDYRHYKIISLILNFGFA